MNTYELNLCGLKRELPIVCIEDNTSIASFVILGDVELVHATAKELVKKIKDIDYIVTAEAKGIPLAFEISRQLGMKEYIVIRKSVKKYMNDPLCEIVQSITSRGCQHLYLDEADAQKLKGKRICIVDDVISTGESLKAIEKLVKRAGGDIKSKVAILAEGDATKRNDIYFLGELPLFTSEPEVQEIKNQLDKTKNLCL